MKKNYRKFRSLSLIAFAAMMIIFSCKRDAEIVDLGYRYFPDNVGHWVIYEIDSTYYNPFNGDTLESRYQVKELIESVFTDNSGRPTLRIERYKRFYNPNIPYDSLPWTLADVWSANRTSNGAERFEENVRYLRLSFPVERGKTWNGNAYNTIGEWRYKYTEADVAYSGANYQFDSTLFVSQIVDTNKLTYRLFNERYAKGVGLIEKNVTDVYDTTIRFTSVLDRIVGGTKYTVRYVAHGN